MKLAGFERSNFIDEEGMLCEVPIKGENEWRSPENG